MPSVTDALAEIRKTIPPQVELIAVSKTHPVVLIEEAYDAGQRHFGENKAQEMTQKAASLPNDIKWHMIGHLQTNKVKYIAPYVHLIHSIDSLHLLQAVDKEAKKNNRKIDCLLQVHVAQEETKFGLTPQELNQMLSSAEFSALENVRICGIMGMATNTDDPDQIRQEFRTIKQLFDETKKKFFPNDNCFKDISMGMSGDYTIAIEEGATMVRIGSSIFGQRNYNLTKKIRIREIT